MADPVAFRINHSQFDAALKQYAALSKRTPAQVCNKKAYYIVRRAIWYTRKSDYGKMLREYGPSARAVSFVPKKNGSGLKVKRGAKIWAMNEEKGAPALALIINWRRGKKSRKGLYGKSMRQAVKKVWGARARSVAYIKSGWITARDRFKRLAGGGGKGLPPSEGQSLGGPKQVGRPKGTATPAIEGKWRARAVFTNDATAKRDHKESVILYGEPALARAYAEETADTMQEVERRLRDDAHKSGIRTN